MCITGMHLWTYVCCVYLCYVHAYIPHRRGIVRNQLDHTYVNVCKCLCKCLSVSVMQCMLYGCLLCGWRLSNSDTIHSIGQIFLGCALLEIEQHFWPVRPRFHYTPPPVVTSRNISRLCQMSLSTKITHSTPIETTALVEPRHSYKNWSPDLS